MKIRATPTAPTPRLGPCDVNNCSSVSPARSLPRACAALSIVLLGKRTWAKDPAEPCPSGVTRNQHSWAAPTAGTTRTMLACRFFGVTDNGNESLIVVNSPEEAILALGDIPKVSLRSLPTKTPPELGASGHHDPSAPCESSMTESRTPAGSQVASAATFSPNTLPEVSTQSCRDNDSHVVESKDSSSGTAITKIFSPRSLFSSTITKAVESS